MKKIFIIDYVIYPFNLLVAIDATTEDILKYLKKEIDFRPSDELIQALEMKGEGRTVMAEEGQTYMRLKDAPKTPFSIGTMAHEISHATTFLLHKLGIKPDIEGDEAQAYLVGYTTREIMKHYPYKTK